MLTSLHMAWVLAREFGHAWGEMSRDEIDRIASAGGSVFLRAGAVRQWMLENGPDCDDGIISPVVRGVGTFVCVGGPDDVGWVIEEADDGYATCISCTRQFEIGKIWATVCAIDGSVGTELIARTSGRVWADHVRLVARAVSAAVTEIQCSYCSADQALCDIHDVCEAARAATAAGDEDSVVVPTPRRVVELTGSEAEEVRAIVAAYAGAADAERLATG